MAEKSRDNEHQIHQAVYGFHLPEGHDPDRKSERINRRVRLLAVLRHPDDIREGSLVL